MKANLKSTISAVMLTMLLLTSFAKAQSAGGANKKPNPAAPQNVVTQAGSTTPVTGSGTAGQLSKWAGSNTTSTVVEDSIITQDKYGKIGIGTSAPTSLLTVKGMVETTLGGYKFPDGTVQLTAAVSGLQSIFHNATLTGSGTNLSLLGIAVPLNLSGASGIPVFRAINTGNGEGVRGQSTDGIGVRGDGKVGVYGEGPLIGVNGVGNDSISGQGGNGVQARGGNSDSNSGGNGMFANGGSSNSGTPGVGIVVSGGNSTSTAAGAGVYASGGSSSTSTGGRGMQVNGGASFSDTGGEGVYASGGDGTGPGSKGGAGIFATGGLGSGGNGLAGKFQGDVQVTGSLNVTGVKNFKIDHPLDPENKYLYHASIESSEVLNLYSGNVTTDANGDAVVQMPEWFEALNKDFRYQLTVIGTFAQAIVASETQNNRFVIKTNGANVKVSWQITGVRNDPSIKKHPMQVEVEKGEKERGFYLQPELYNQPAERSVDYALHPELMKNLEESKEMGKQAKQKSASNQ